MCWFEYDGIPTSRQSNAERRPPHPHLRPGSECQSVIMYRSLPSERSLYVMVHVEVLHKSCLVGIYVSLIKREARGRVVPEGERFISDTYGI